MSDRPAIVLDVTLTSMKACMKQWVEEHLCKEQVTSAIDRAFSQFDIYAEIEKQAKEAIAKAISEAGWDIGYPLKNAIRAAVDERVRQLIEPIVKRMTDGLVEETKQ